MALPFTENMAEVILTQTDNPIRFEKFCIDLFSEVDVVRYVPTSVSWDLGRDARGVELGDVEDTPFIACSLRADVPDKALADLERLLESGPVTTLRLCSSQLVSEHGLEAIKALLRDRCLTLEYVNADGALQIASLVARDGKLGSIFVRYYRTEVESLREALLTPTPEQDRGALTGMRIALTTQLNPQGDALRAEVIQNLILGALSDKKAKAKPTIAKSVSDQLQLNRSVDNLYLEPNFAQLESQGEIVASGSGFVITQAGVTRLADLTARGAKELMQGQKLVRSALEELSGEKLADDTFGQLWRLLQDEIAVMFYENGMQIIEAVRSIGTSNSSIKHHKEVSEMIRDLRGKVERQFLNSPLGEAFGQAVEDMLYDKQLPTYEWFANLCACYVTVCSLGLEPAAQQAVFARLKSIDLLLDTDIVLSLLSVGEPDHTAVKEILAGWRTHGGSLLVADSVLEETAYHAWISENDFREVQRQLVNYSDAEARRLITNAFVRGYRWVSRRDGIPMSRTNWLEYRENFRGADSRDSSRILEELQDVGVSQLSDEGSDPAVAEEISNQLKYQRQAVSRGKPLSKQDEDKSRRDGRVVAVLVHHARRREAK